MPAALRWFAVVAPGLEGAARDEIAALPDVAEIAAETGGVAWTGPAATGLRANLWSRVATRVLARVGEVEAREFGKLRHRAGAPALAGVRRARARRWRRAPAPATAASTTRARWPRRRCSRSRTPSRARAPPRSDEPADVTLLVRGVDDRFMFSADASGELLHRRGARIETGAAPLRETLAAGLLALAAGGRGRRSSTRCAARGRS